MFLTLQSPFLIDPKYSLTFSNVLTILLHISTTQLYVTWFIFITVIILLYLYCQQIKHHAHWHSVYLIDVMCLNSWNRADKLFLLDV